MLEGTCQLNPPAPAGTPPIVPPSRIAEIQQTATLSNDPMTDRGDPPQAAPPRVWVDYNKWGVAQGHGKVFLAPANATDLPLAEGPAEKIPTHKRAHGAEIVTLHEGMTVRLMDLDGDEHNRPCTLEVNGTVHLEPGRHWYADYLQAEMVWMPRGPDPS